MRHHQEACLWYLGTYLRQLRSTAEESKQPKVPLIARDIVRRHGPTVPWHLPVTTPKNGQRGEVQTLLSVATSAGTGAWPTAPQHLSVTTTKNGRRGEVQTLLSVAMSAGTVHGHSALTCDDSEERAKGRIAHMVTGLLAWWPTLLS